MTCSTNRSIVRGLTLLILLGLTLISGPVLANGRYPQAMRLREDPTDPERLWLMTTYGLLTTGDSGKKWSWICEDALGFNSSQIFDPMFDLTENGTVLMGLLKGLRASPDKGCTWIDPNQDLVDHFVLDLAVDPSQKSRAIILVSEGKSADSSTGVVYTNQIWETKDDGKTVSLLAQNLPEDIYITTLDSAPDDPSRIYLSAEIVGSGVQTPVFYRSRNRTQTWENVPLPIQGDEAAFIAAVDPVNADVVYVRTFQRKSDNTLSSALLYTTDAGDHWKELYRGSALMAGFALSPDRSQVVIGLRDPQDGDSVVDPSAVGIFRASTSDFKFTRIFDKNVACLTWTARGLYACSEMLTAGFDVGLSTDQGQSFTPIQNRREIAGPLACPSTSTVGMVCTPQSFALACEQSIGCEVPDAGAADAGPTHAARAQDDDGGCALAGHKVSTELALFGAAFAVFGLLRRGRRRHHESS